jgi:hypothetical protein
MVRSLRDKPQGRNVALYVFDIGLNEPQRGWLLAEGATLHVPQDPILSRPGTYGRAWPLLHALISRSQIPDLFPDHDVYLWIDADAWIQRWEAVEAYIDGALRAGFAVTPESDPAYEAYLEGVLRAKRVVQFDIGSSFAMFGNEYLEPAGRTRRTGRRGGTWLRSISTKRILPGYCFFWIRRRFASCAGKVVSKRHCCRRLAIGSVATPSPWSLTTVPYCYDHCRLTSLWESSIRPTTPSGLSFPSTAWGAALFRGPSVTQTHSQLAAENPFRQRNCTTTELLAANLARRKTQKPFEQRRPESHCIRRKHQKVTVVVKTWQ